ncbi:M48 family metallopeptidase [Halorussus amylolyticus]|uniref:M48 family metallopeptidase n=1 Tax=Halorussus amylolyticus TaxID=1126242 RepID=UPI00192F7872|nr:SprT family zinc-dependent metalloprotease [Halorussus amylolyticus]
MSTTMHELHIGQVTVPYEVTWSADRSTIGIALDQSMELTVTAPPAASHEDIKDALDDRKEWILRTLAGLSEQAHPPTQKEFLSGEKLRYNGRRYRLCVTHEERSDPSLSFDGSTFDLRVPTRLDGQTRYNRIHSEVVDWYVTTAREQFPSRVEKYRTKLAVTPDEVSVADLHAKWGEFQEGVVRLNWRLLLAPTDIQDYVVVHELVHTDHDTHSEQFWNAVGTLIPDYERRREWLRLHGNTLQI